ncbi:unnamed protein product [Clavelina lepadiformis]|uniref:Lipid-binding serum glycoprotein C-terminal domain-containing protein n=1 Tax=Clavelina lepadiformis TaxID=159417 RepID=A0ABP0FG70_CLALP
MLHAEMFALNLLLLLSYLALAVEGVINDDGTSLAGIKLRVHKRGLDLIRDLTINYAQDNLDKLTIPDFDGTYEFSNGGAASYAFSKVAILDINPGSISLIPAPPNIATISVSGADISVSGDWEASGSFPFTVFGVSVPIQLDDSGTFRIDVTEASLTQSVTLGYDSSTGKPTMIPSDCSVSIGELSLDVDSKLGGIVNFLANIASNTIKGFLEDQICPGLKNIVEGQATEYINSTPFIVPLFFDTSIFLGFVCEPATTEDYFQFFTHGRCFPNDNPDIMYDISPTETPPLSLTDEMARVSISDYVVKTLLHSLSVNEFFHYQVDPDQISDLLGSDLFDFLLTFLIPALQDPEYNGRPIQLSTYPPSPPSADFAPGEIRMAGYYSIDVEVILDDGSVEPVATATAYATGIALVELNNTIVTGKITQPAVDSVTAEGLPATVLEPVLNTLLQNAVVPALNRILENGYELPNAIAVIAFEMPSFELKEGVLEIGTDLKLAN